MQEIDNPIIRLVMEIIQRDSQMHYWIQGWIADTIKYKSVNLNPDELVIIGQALERHIELERKMIENAKQMLTNIEGKRFMLAQQYFISYLLDDETKHSRLLESLRTLASGMRDSD